MMATAFALSACSTSNPAGESDDLQSSAGAEPQSSSPSYEGNVEEYFDLMLRGEPEQSKRASELAAPSSPAEKYAVHRANVENAVADNGQDYSADESTTEYLDEAVEYCDGPEWCSVFSDFTFVDGKIESFTVDDVAIDDRIVVGGGEIANYQSVVGFEFLSAYQSATDDSLQAVVRFHAYDRDISTNYIANYRDPSGRQILDQDSLIPSQINSNSNQLAFIGFPAAEVGGDLLLKFATDDDGPLIVETLSVPTA